MKKIIGIASGIFLMSVFGFANTETEEEPESENAIVHIYRPSSFVGFGWIFKVKANTSKLAKLKNGRNLTVEMYPGITQLQLKKSLVEIKLESGKHYYLRASLKRNMLLGKPELVEVTESQAQKEMSDL